MRIIVVIIVIIIIIVVIIKPMTLQNIRENAKTFLITSLDIILDIIRYS